jgi:3-oxoadipate enol-lactonase
MPHADSSGTRIYWTACGEGEPLLLIMGLGYAHDMWHRTIPRMSAHYRVIAFDNRGVGQSEAPPGPYPIPMMAADAAAVLDAAGVESAHVFGVSMGGMIAQEFALQYPHRVRKLVLGCTACGGPKAERPEPEAVAVLMKRGSMAMEEAMESAIPFIYDPRTPRERIDEDFAIRRRCYPSGEVYNAQLQGIIGWQSYARLAQISGPVLVIHGESDRLVPPGNGRLIADTIPGAQWSLLPEASHIFMTDQPERSNAEVLGFLKG